MAIAHICQRNVDTAAALEPVRSAAQRMATRCVGTLLVLDHDRRPVGIVTDRDIALRVIGEGLDPASTTVADVMTRSPATIEEQASVDDALALMRARGVRRLPVIGFDGQLCGLISMDDILALMAEEMWQLGRVVAQSSPAALAEA